MKILLFLIISLVIGKFSRATDTLFVDGTKFVHIDSTKLSLRNVYTDVKDALKGLGSALKVGSEHVYEVLIKQQLTNSITLLSIFLLLLIFTTIFWKLSTRDRKRLRTKEDSWFQDDLEQHPLSIIYTILAILFTIILIIVISVNLQDVITGFINPEYGALKDIMKMIHSN